MNDSFPERLAQAAIRYHEDPRPFTGVTDIKIIDRSQVGHYRRDEERDGYWVQAEVFVPYSEIEPGPSTTYDVWIAEQEVLGFAPGGTYPGAWLWSHDASFTCDAIDPTEREAADASARQSAHEHGRYLRDTYPCAYVAVRAAHLGKPLPIRCDPE